MSRVACPPEGGESASRLGGSTRSLVLSNLFTIVLAVVQRWSLAEVMWVYWGQSVVIGYYNWRKIRSLREFTTDNFTINDRPVPPTESTRRQVAAFFAVHYGLFHFVYLVFLLSESADVPWWGALSALACIAVFGVNHRESFRSSIESFVRRKPNIGSVMFFPYARVVPMQLTIVLGHLFGPGSLGSLVFFLLLKTGADVLMHTIEHRHDGP